jgi:hypothetical protein
VVGLRSRRRATVTCTVLKMFALNMTKDELIRLRDWVDAKLTKGVEPQWSRGQCMKLRDGLDAILACPGTEYLKKSAARAGVYLPLAHAANRGAPIGSAVSAAGAIQGVRGKDPDER